jgi:peroxiredoxin
MKSSQLAQLAFIVVAAVAVYSFVATARDGERRRVCSALCHLSPNYSGRNRMAPEIELPTVAGGTLKLSSYRSKVVVLNFWTKNCRPCLEEMPSLAELAASLKRDKDIVVLTVSTDESVEDVRGTLRSVIGSEAAFETGVDSDSKFVGGKYGTRLYPETWLIDPRGVIRARFDGVRNWSSALVIDMIQGLKDPVACSVAFDNGRASGEDAPICEDIAG